MKNPKPTPSASLGNDHEIVPLSRIITKRLFILFSFLVLVFSFTTYTYLIKETDAQFQAQLLEYVNQRGQRESKLFHLAKDNLRQFREEFVFHYKTNPKRDFSDWFLSHMTSHDDGTIRSLPKYFDGTWTTDSTLEKGISLIVAPDVRLTEEIRRRVGIAYQQILLHGPAWRSRFVNLWFVAPEKISLTYWPEVPWCLNMPADYNWEAKEWFYGTWKEHNPQRSIIWTDIYFDAPADRWMISSALPIDVDGKQIATIGTDIHLDEMFKRTLSNNPIVSYSMILGQQGRVIVHPDKWAEIKAGYGAGAPVTVASSNNSQLRFLFDSIQAARTFPMIIDDVENNQFFAVTRIEGPGWYLISVSSKALFKDKIIQNARFMLAVTVVSLITALLMIYWVVRKNIAMPLGLLTEATRKIGYGTYESLLQGSEPQNEIGELASAFNDMSKQVMAREKALLTSKEEWERTFNAITDVVTLQTPDMRIVQMNKSGCEALGMPYGEIHNKHCYELFYDRTTPCQQCPLLETKETLAPSTQEMYYEKLDKTFLVSAAPILNDEGKLINIVHVAKDVTSFKKLGEDRLRLAAAIDQASEVVVITDIKGTIQYINPAFEKLTGYSREEAIGQNPRVLKSGMYDRKFYKKMWSELLAGKVWKGHLVNKKKDGSLFEEEVSISPVTNSAGQIVNFVAVKRDVSREVSLEKQLRQAMKMEAVGTLAGGIAHDFNNILSGILGFTEIAKSALPADDAIGKYLDHVIQATHRATDLVKQLLTFSRQGDDDFRPVKIQYVIKEVLKLLRSSLPATIRITGNISADVRLILADPTQIHQVLMNLCTNAKHAIGEELGTLGVSLSVIEISAADTPADCPPMTPGTWLDLEVSDTGCGMDDVILSKIFDPFFTTKEQGKGTGLGLAVVHGIIRNHGGEITVSSEPGQGTTFHIYLPVINELQTVPEGPRPEAAAIPRGSERILFVDDEKMIGEMMGQTLEGLGYAVSIFTSGVDLLEVFTKNPGDCDLVITDMTMPEMTGVDLTQKLLAIQPDLPVILCTGYSEIIDAEKAKSLGIREYIKKPFDIRTLATVIRKTLEA